MMGGVQYGHWYVGPSPTLVTHMLTQKQKAVLCILNVQHNCYDGKCAPTGRQRRRQERTLTEIEDPFVEHNDDERYIVNTHALHNAALIRKFLPRHLIAPVPYIDPAVRDSEHRKMAASLRSMHAERRTKEAAARKDRREKTAAAKKAQTENGEEQVSHGEGSRSRPKPRKRVRSEVDEDLDRE